MADKKRTVSDQELAQAMDKAWKNSEKDQETVQAAPVEEPNKRMDVFPELLAKKPKVIPQMIPTYGSVLPQGSCQKACKLNVAKILAMKEAEEKLEQRRRENREELRKAAETAAIILMAIAVGVLCICGAAFLTEFI